MKKNFAPGGSAPGGFSAVELLVVLAVVGILALTAGPALTRLVPRQQVRGEAWNVAAVMRQARLKAAATQKPIRVVLDCSGLKATRPQACSLSLQSAIYDQGAVTGWLDISGRTLNERVTAVKTAPGPAPDGETTPPDDLAWLIFMPSGRAFSNPRPFDIFFHSRGLPRNPRPGWRLKVNNDSGRAALAGHNLNRP